MNREKNGMSLLILNSDRHLSTQAQIKKTPLNRCGSGVILLCNKSFEQTILF